jgi:two-component system OmpR family response regulator
MTIKRVMLVDDEDDIRLIGEMALTEIGLWDVLTASSGAEALEKIGQMPDVVLLDVMMPGMEGPDVLQAFQRDPAVRHIPVIFMTAKVQKHEILHYLEIGARGVIAKPFDPLTLHTQIQKIVDNGQTP